MAAQNDDKKIVTLIKEWQAENGDKPFVSFEYYPPRTEEGVKNLYSRMDRMAKQNPLFADITWGAGGSTSELTVDIALEMQKKGLVPNMHLTCTNMEATKVSEALASCKESGIKNIVALRGDPPKGQDEWKATEGGFTCALDLVKHMRKEHGDYFCISVAGYPEGHPNVIKPVEGGADGLDKLTASEAGRLVKKADGTYLVCSDADYAKEIAYLKEKVDAGADLIITQMFFDTKVFVSFVAACRAAGINVPILPGLMLIQNAKGFGRMTGFCSTRVPEDVARHMNEVVKEDSHLAKEYGAELGARMCKELMEAGTDATPGLHFYTLNLERTTFAVLKTLGRLIEEEEAAPAAAEQPAAAAGAAAVKASILTETMENMGKGTILSESVEKMSA